MVLDPKEQEIRKLLDRFWEGDTSLDEERDLKEYFLFAQVPEDLQETATYFRSLSHLPDEELGEEFDEDVLRQIQSPGGGRLVRLNFFQQHWKQIAAAVIVLATASWMIWSWNPIAQNDKIYTAEGEVEDREVREAFLEAKKALFLLSGKMEQGNRQMKQLKKFDEATQQLKEMNHD